MTNKTIKKPDAVTEELRQGFQWTVKHYQGIGLAFLLFLLVGGGYSTVTYLKNSKEEAIQEEYYKIERTYLDKKQSFEQAEADTKKPEDKKNTKVDKKSEQKPVVQKATGDLETDYGTVVKGFNEVIAKSPQSKAARMAALNLSEIQLKYKKTEEAIGTLTKLEKNLDRSDLLSSLVKNQLGNVLSEKSDCQNAISKWSDVISDKKVSYLHDETKLRMGLCYENLKDFAKAEQLYSEVQSSKPESVVGRTAEKYLRLLKTQNSKTN